MLNSANPTLKLQSGFTIPCLGFGTYQIRGRQCVQSVKWALKAGYRHIDTASIYKNQEDVGKAISQSNISRNQIFITSKVSPDQQGYQNAKEACERSLKKLRVDYLDLILIHWPGISKTNVKSLKNCQVRRQTWRALIQLKKIGKVRDIGVSNFSKHHLQDIIKYSGIKPAVNQFQLHPLLWEQQTINYCRQNGIVIQAYSPLARGDKQLFKNPTIFSLAVKYQKSIAQICLRWSLDHGFVVLPKSSNHERINQNYDLNFKLSEEDINSINELSELKVRVCWDPHQIIH